MVDRARLFAAAALLGSLSACAPTLGPPPPARISAAPANDAFRAGDFAWSQGAGRGAVVGKLTFAPGPVRYSCAGASVILTPETPWSRRRMVALYKSDSRAALPTDEVRARTPMAPPGDSGPYIRRTTCDAADHFSFSGLPEGSWYAITIAKPVSGAGVSMALMRRVTTHAGRVTPADL
jgi:hypothetical protein